MAEGIIYMVDAQGGLQRMTPSAPENEDRMQALVAKHPDLISDGDGDLLLIRREQSITDDDDASARWSLDHLFVTKSAVPVLVELKRAVDTRLRREVVGQILDYAANATAYWQSGRVAASFADTVTNIRPNDNPEVVLKEFIGDQNPGEFWEQVDANFKAGRIKLVIVADVIPRELARVVEFLNDQMRADVRAVELRWFSGEGGVVTLAPRVIGETERAAAAKSAASQLPPLSVAQWIQANVAPLGEKAVESARTFVAIIERLGGQVDTPLTQGSLRAGFRGTDGKPFYPIHLWKALQVSLSFGYIHLRPSLQEPAVRQALLDGLRQIVGPTSTNSLTGFPGFKAELLADSETAAGFERWLSGAVEQMR